MAHRNAGPETTAVVVTCGTTRYLRRTLEGIAAQAAAITCSRRGADLPRREISANIYKSGVRAMPVTVTGGDEPMQARSTSVSATAADVRP